VRRAGRLAGTGDRRAHVRADEAGEQSVVQIPVLARRQRGEPESWEQAAAQLVMNEVEFRALLAGIAADDPYADL
jgi:hypothetical protein